MSEGKQSDQYKGWLYKWTNYLKGYQKRWFVVQNGLLSYYRNQAEMTHTCRGTINLAHACIEPYDSLTFVISNGATQTYHLKASSELDRKRWVTALVLAKSKAASLSNASEDSDDMEGECSEAIKNDVESFLTAMARRLEDLSSCQALVARQGDSLTKALTDLESSRDPGDTATRIRAINEKATVFRVAASAMINACSEFTSNANSQVRRWQRLLQNEREQRSRLEAMVEELAKQHRALESKVAAVRSPRASLAPHPVSGTASPIGRRATGRAASIGDVTPGQGRSPVGEDEEEEEDFYDAVEHANDFDSSGFIVSLPRLPATSDVTEDAESLYKPDEYESDDSLDEREPIDLCEAQVITKREQLSRSGGGGGQVLRKADSAPEAGEDDVKRRSTGGGFGDLQRRGRSSAHESPSRRSLVTARQRRKAIPPKPDYSVNLWSIMKNCIGKDLTKIPMPVNFSEPLSMLQRLTEDYEYADVLDAAVKASDSAEQLAFVAAFMVSSYSTTTNRTGKPFNPLLGETFEHDRIADLGWRSLAEQVSHHPPASALHVEGRDWSSWQQYSMQSKFRGKYLQVNPRGSAHVRLPSCCGGPPNVYSWTKVTTTVHNIVVGKLWVDNHGETDIVNHTTGEKCHLVFKAYSYFSRDPLRHVTGVVSDKDGNTRYVLNGCWDSYMEGAQVLSSCRSSGGKAVLETGPVLPLWQRRPVAPHAAKMYNFTQLAVELNEPEEGVAPTDTRLRPDQRLMEEGRWDEANAEKQRLEENQRSRRKKREEPNEDQENESEIDLQQDSYQPVWFRLSMHPETGVRMYHFSGDYWSAKSRHDWSRCPEIF